MSSLAYAGQVLDIYYSKVVQVSDVALGSFVAEGVGQQTELACCCCWRYRALQLTCKQTNACYDYYGLHDCCPLCCAEAATG